MPIRFQPAIGQILICDFPKDFEKPEMVKRRPVVCISPKDRNRFGYATPVPLSTTEPMVKRSYNVEINLCAPISPAYPSLKCWAKCDMLYTLSYKRLSLPLLCKDGGDGKREYNYLTLPAGTMCEIFTGVLAGYGVTGSVKVENGTFQVFDFRDVLC